MADVLPYVPPVITGPPAAPAFSAQPSVVPGAGRWVGSYWGVDGAASGTMRYTRRWLLDGVFVGSSRRINLSNSSGQLVYEVTAEGPGGRTTTSSPAVTVTSGGAPAPGPELIVVPPEFAARWPNLPGAYRRSSDGLYSTTLDTAALKPSGGTTYYLDPVAGADGQSGITRSVPWRNLAASIGKMAAGDTLVIINMTSDYVARASQGWANAIPAGSISIIVEGGYRFVSAQQSTPSNGAVQTFARNATYPNVYQMNATAAQGAGATDFSTKRAPAFAAGAVVPAYGLAVLAAAPKRYRALVKVASVEAVSTTPNSFFWDSSGVFYLRTIDDRDLTVAANAATVVVHGTANNGRMPGVSNAVVFLSGSEAGGGIDLVGGRPLYAINANNITGCLLVGRFCSFQCSTVTDSKGLTVTSKMTSIMYRCGAYDNKTDGFNYTSPDAANGDPATETTSPNFIEIECVGQGNGTTDPAGDPSSNASTAHNYVNGLRLNCVYPDSDDRALAETGYAYTWNMGVLVGQAAQQMSGKETIAALQNVRMWLDGCRPLRGAGQTNADFIAAQSATIYHRNMSPVPTNAGTLEATGNMVAY